MVYRNTVMPVTIKETPDRGLCGTCAMAHIREGDRFSETVIQCSESGRSGRVTFLVRSCSDYARRNDLDKYDMEKIAWILEVKKGRFIGFRPPKDLADQE